MLLVGLTGGIGSGKSTVAKLLQERGAIIVDGDQIAREIVEPGMPALKELVEEFGPDILHSEGTLNRAGLARIAFATPEATAKLNAITHPRIDELTFQRFAEAPKDSVVVFDMPLLVENNLASMCGLVIVVNATEDVRAHRLIKHRGFTEEDARRRMKAQLSEAERSQWADVLIDNSGAREKLRKPISRLWSQRIEPWIGTLTNPTDTTTDKAAPAAGSPASRGITAIRPEWRTVRTRERLAYALAMGQANQPHRITHSDSQLQTCLNAIHLSPDHGDNNAEPIRATVTHTSTDHLKPHPIALTRQGFIQTKTDETYQEWVSADPFNPVTLELRTEN